MLWHYTTLNALIGILRKDSLCFWGGRYDSMNDPTDFIYAQERIDPFLKKFLKDQQMEDEIDNSKDYFPYIVSFSKKRDDFNMWRLYNAEVAIGLKRCILTSEQNTLNERRILKEVLYTTDKMIHSDAFKLFKEEVKRDKELMEANIIETFYTEIFPFIKDKAYKIESEVRLVEFDCSKVANKKSVGVEITNPVKCRGVRNGLLLLYKEFLISQKALKKIIIRTHDDNYFQKIKEQLELILISCGFKSNVVIERSTCSPFLETKK